MTLAIDAHGGVDRRDEVSGHERWMAARTGANLTEVLGSSRTVFPPHSDIVVPLIEETAK